MNLEDIEPITLDFGKLGKVTFAPVRHGYWKQTRMMNAWKQYNTRYMCNRCKHTQKTQSPFCGGCGARMDGEDHG